jgi:mRNA interferase MazF
MISSQLGHEVAELDEVVRDADADFSQTGLKMTSLIRVTRVAVVSGDLFLGALGELSMQRLTRIRTRLAEWIRGGNKNSSVENQ